MSRPSATTWTEAAGAALFAGYWGVALLASPDVIVVLGKRILLPLLGKTVPAVPFLVAAPLLGLLIQVAIRSRRGWGAVPAAAIPAASLLNAFRCLKLQSPPVIYFSAAAAVTSTLFAAWRRLASAPFRRERSLGDTVVAAAGVLAALVADGVLLFLFVPWVVRGDMPGKLNGYPFGPVLRTVLFPRLPGLDLGDRHSPRSLRGVRLGGANLNGSKLAGADLKGAFLFHASLNWADLRGADLSGAVLSGAWMSYSDFQGANLSGAELTGDYVWGSNFRGAVFRDARERTFRFIYSDCREADFTSAKLSGSTFFDSDCRGAVFRGADLNAVFLTRARFDGTDLSGADLSKADLREATFRDAVLDGAILMGANIPRPEALAEARSLRGAVLDPWVFNALRRLRPDLF